MRIQRSSDMQITIDAGAPSNVASIIDLTDATGTIENLSVTLDLDHTWTSDLEILIESPEGKRALLVRGRGGSGNNFRETQFQDNASSSIANASPPFRGAFKPENALNIFRGVNLKGKWKLKISDKAFLDGGSLNRWSLTIDVKDENVSDFNIDLRFLGGLSPSQQDVFDLAAKRWSKIIVGDLPDVNFGMEVIDDVLIEAQGASIDGISGILGQAGPTFIRSDSNLPFRGIMSFDSSDLSHMEDEGSLVRVIVHEMGHVLGIGTLWQRMGLLQGAGSSNPIFTGIRAMQEFAKVASSDVPTPIPVANTGGAGTRDGHWRESVFGNELMTGFLSSGSNPLSRVTIGALSDMGYTVNMDAADNYALPSTLELALMGIGSDVHGCDQHCRVYSPTPVVVDVKTGKLVT